MRRISLSLVCAFCFASSLAATDSAYADVSCGGVTSGFDCEGWKDRGDPGRGGGGPGNGGGGGSGGGGKKVKPQPVEWGRGFYCFVKPGFGARECQDFEVVPADPVNPVEPVPGEPITIRDVAHFPVNKGELVIQPGGGQHTVNMKGNVYSTAAMHELTLPLLGEPLTVQFIPVDFAFDFGDGTPVVAGAGAGAAYPDGNIRHVYRKVGTFTITVTTTWMANYKDPDSGMWIPIPGTLSTTVQSPPQQVNEYHIVLTDPTG